MPNDDDDHRLRRPTSVGVGAVPRSRFREEEIDSVRMDLLSQLADHRADVHHRLIDLREQLRDIKATQSTAMMTTENLATQMAKLQGGISTLKWIIPLSITLAGGIVAFALNMTGRLHP